MVFVGIHLTKSYYILLLYTIKIYKIHEISRNIGRQMLKKNERIKNASSA